MIAYALALLTLKQPIQDSGGFVRTINRTDGVAVSQTASRKLVAAGMPDVWLVGAAHIGMKHYYADMQAVLDAQDVVLFEGVRSKARPMTPPKVDPKAPKALYQVISDAIGLDFQLVDINYNRPHWVNSDLTMEQLDALNKAGGHGKPTQFDMVEKMLDPNSPQSKMLGTFFTSATPSIKDAFKIFLVDKVAKIDSILAATTDPTTLNVLLTERNKSVARVFDKVLHSAQPPKSIGVFYGAAHMKEIEKALAAKYGYKATEQRWFTFAKADRKKLDEAGRQFLNMLETSAKGL